PVPAEAAGLEHGAAGRSAGGAPGADESHPLAGAAAQSRAFAAGAGGRVSRRAAGTVLPLVPVPVADARGPVAIAAGGGADGGCVRAAAEERCPDPRTGAPGPNAMIVQLTSRIA